MTAGIPKIPVAKALIHVIGKSTPGIKFTRYNIMAPKRALITIFRINFKLTLNKNKIITRMAKAPATTASPPVVPKKEKILSHLLIFILLSFMSIY